MPIRDEKTFTDDEVTTAFELVMPKEVARLEAQAFNRLPDLHDFETATPQELAAAPACGPRSYDGDFLDLMSLVSESCADRAWRLLGVSVEEGHRRREQFKLRLKRGGEQP